VKIDVAAEDLDRIKQLTAWEKNKKITGDVRGLQKALSSSDDATLRDARTEYNEAKQKIDNRERAHVDDYGDPPSHTASSNETEGHDHLNYWSRATEAELEKNVQDWEIENGRRRDYSGIVPRE